MTSDDLAKLYDLKQKGVLTEAEYEAQKVQFLKAGTQLQPAALQPVSPVSPKMLEHGIPLLIGAIVMFGCIGGCITGNSFATNQASDEALGILVLFSAWIIPHSIWVLRHKGANMVLPILALVGVGLGILENIGGNLPN